MSVSMAFITGAGRSKGIVVAVAAQLSNRGLKAIMTVCDDQAA